MAPVAEIGKQRAARIKRDYFHRLDFYQRWKWYVTAIIGLVTLGWLGLGLVPSYGSAARYSHGTLASVHATWDTSCAACHERFRPVNDNRWLFRFFGGSATAVTSGCQGCHAGPPHHASITPGSEQTCGGCHRDHQGRDASLVRVADSACTRCHASLAAYHREGKATYQKVTSFLTDHPEFQPLTVSPQRGLKFSHAVHMSRLQKPGPEGRLDPVQLTCASCHRLDASDVDPGPARLAGLPADAVLAPRPAGRIMQPVVYELHCKECHPLTVSDANLNLTVPHRLQPDRLAEFLRAAYLERVVEGTPGLLDRPLRPRLDPKEEAEAKTVRQRLGERLSAAERRLYEAGGVCGQCHDSAPAKNGGWAGVAPKHTRSVWFQHAHFGHASHRAIDCRQCHAGAYPPEKPSALLEKEPLLISGIETCRQCHWPATTGRQGDKETGRQGANVLSSVSLSPGLHVSLSPSGGARHDCTECHSYHHGDAPLQGVGAAARDPAPAGSDRRTIEEFLRGNLRSRQP